MAIVIPNGIELDIIYNSYFVSIEFDEICCDLRLASGYQALWSRMERLQPLQDAVELAKNDLGFLAECRERVITLNKLKLNGYLNPNRTSIAAYAYILFEVRSSIGDEALLRISKQSNRKDLAEVKTLIDWMVTQLDERSDIV